MKVGDIYPIPNSSQWRVVKTAARSNWYLIVLFECFTSKSISYRISTPKKWCVWQTEVKPVWDIAWMSVIQCHLSKCTLRGKQCLFFFKFFQCYSVTCDRAVPHTDIYHSFDNQNSSWLLFGCDIHLQTQLNGYFNSHSLTLTHYKTSVYYNGYLCNKSSDLLLKLLIKVCSKCHSWLSVVIKGT